MFDPLNAFLDLISRDHKLTAAFNASQAKIHSRADDVHLVCTAWVIFFHCKNISRSYVHDDPSFKLTLLHSIVKDGRCISQPI